MAQITTGYTWSSGNTVTAALLNQSVNSATIANIANEDISAGAGISLSKLAAGALPSGITVSSANITDGTIVNADISGTAAIAYSKLNLANSIATGDIAPAAITGPKLSGAQAGSAPVFGVRAWANFNGTRNAADDGASTNGANVHLRASGNVASVLKNATGDYTITFTTAMPDANYAVVITTCGNSTTNQNRIGVVKGVASTGASNKTTTGVTIQTGSTATGAEDDMAEVNVMVLR